MTKYFYDGTPLSHIAFISLMRKYGIESGYRVSSWEHLNTLAKQGHPQALELLSHITIAPNN